MSYIPTPQGMTEQTVKFYNPTLDHIKVQCDSRVFRFAPRGYVEVPFSLMYILEKQLAATGVFIVYPQMTQADFKKKEFERLKHYKDSGILRDRLMNFFAYVDEQKRRGNTVEETIEMKRALRMRRELEVYLKENKETDVELSFFDESQRKEFGLDVVGAQHVASTLPPITDVTTEEGFKVVDAEVPELEGPRRSGRPRKPIDSYAELEA